MQWDQDQDVNHTFAALMHILHNEQVTLHIIECTCKQMVLPCDLHSNKKQVEDMLQLEGLQDVQIMDEKVAAVTYQNILYLGKFMVFEYMYSKWAEKFELSVGAEPYFRYFKHFCIEGDPSAPDTVKTTMETFIAECKHLKAGNRINDRVLLLITSDVYYTFFLDLAQLTDRQHADQRVSNVFSAMQKMESIDSCANDDDALNVMATYSAGMSAISAEIVQGLFSEDNDASRRKAQKLLQAPQGHNDVNTMNVLYCLTSGVSVNSAEEARDAYQISNQGRQRLQPIMWSLKTQIENLVLGTFMTRMIAEDRVCNACSEQTLDNFKKSLKQKRMLLCVCVQGIKFCKDLLSDSLRLLKNADNSKAEIEACYAMQSVLQRLVA